MAVALVTVGLRAAEGASSLEVEGAAVCALTPGARRPLETPREGQTRAKRAQDPRAALVLAAPLPPAAWTLVGQSPGVK